MKKMSMIAVLALGVAMASGVAMAHSGGVYDAPKVSDADIKFDGVLDDAAWKKAPAAIIDETKVPSWQQFGTHLNGEELTGPNDCKAVWKAAYSDKYFYFMVDVTDDVFVSGTDVPDYNVDTVELWMDGQNVGADAHEKGVTSQIRLSAQLNSGAAGVQMGEAGGAWASVQLTDDPEAKMAGKVTPTGYVIEIGIPWASAEEWIGTPAKTIGFDVQLNDNDGDGRVSILAWSGGENNNWQYPNLMGDLNLK
jgi:endo-1,4-beta-xylanase